MAGPPEHGKATASVSYRTPEDATEPERITYGNENATGWRPAGDRLATGWRPAGDRLATGNEVVTSVMARWWVDRFWMCAILFLVEAISKEPKPSETIGPVVNRHRDGHW